MEPRTKKILIGCFGGCGLVLLAAVGSCIGFVVWLNSPGEVLEQPERLLGDDTSAYVEWTLRLEDPGTLDFVTHLLDRLQEIDRRQEQVLPGGLQGWLSSFRRRQAEKDLQRMFPLVVAWTARPGRGGREDFHLASISARGLSHQAILLDWILSKVLRSADEITLHKHAGETIYEFLGDPGEPQLAVFIRRGVLFVASDVETAIQALDRVAATAAPRSGSTELETRFAAVPDQPLRGALSNRRGEIRRFLDFLGAAAVESDDLWGAIGGASVYGRFTEELAFDGSIVFHTSDPVWAAANGPRIADALQPVFEDTAFEIATDAVVEGGDVRFEFSIRDVAADLDSLIERKRETTDP